MLILSKESEMTGHILMCPFISFGLVVKPLSVRTSQYRKSNVSFLLRPVSSESFAMRKHGWLEM